MPRYPTQRAVSAGGVVCDDRPDGRRWVLLIAHRNAAGRAQWTLPKGGLEPGETEAEAAVREVREETGHVGIIQEPLGTIDYWFVWRPDQIRYHKYVHYFLMWCDDEEAGPRDDEAEAVEWVPLEIALVRLAHRNERALVRLAQDVPRLPLEMAITHVEPAPALGPGSSTHQPGGSGRRHGGLIAHRVRRGPKPDVTTPATTPRDPGPATAGPPEPGHRGPAGPPRPVDEP